MHLVMFDIDGTLVESTLFDDIAYTNAVEQELNINLKGDWENYTNVTDTGLLQEILKRYNINTHIDNVIESVKNRFFKNIKKYLDIHGINEIPGASTFLNKLSKRDDLKLAMATGGWLKSAEMKLRAAGIEYSSIPLATSDDHHTRIGIMQIAEGKTTIKDFKSKVYFGDAVWDKKACNELGYDFIAIGNKVEHHQCYENYTQFSMLKPMDTSLHW